MEFDASALVEVIYALDEKDLRDEIRRLLSK